LYITVKSEDTEALDIRPIKRNKYTLEIHRTNLMLKYFATSQ